ncbi:tRNA pseudouridine(55) synthase TruB [Vagococcus intermedius]|uniref:tRNA pseudouridine synthase B n=1 Tax=Vagococcus intermedius TaxID=2991418 RepID=A0AAF0CTP1_9ENTE|nr:tRNA pseudouridine(55) synthase TruB [Vagococcus intermedius]WEG72753.1 tRNA pseudouridine(55) synthase TruB [Vagococcus intermedius]WEG74839.1 tRNA pseudouridine(55) synthase TruB [Vagococcus intermedius]
MDGILPLWKERGMTSHDCVFKLRKILKTKKVGHGGTLDPDVDGVLPICIGKGTKVIEYLQDSGKIYVGEITLGYTTTTEDVSGDIVEKTPVLEMLETTLIDETMNQMVGTITQIPPMYSAVKVNGKRLYEYAREGLEVERPERKAVIDYFKRTSEPVYNVEKQTLSWRFEVGCGKGTYVRTLAVDTGAKLGYAAHMSDLTRVSSGGFSAGQCLTLTQVSEKMAGEEFDFLQPIEQAMSLFQRLDLTDLEYQSVKDGGFLKVNDYCTLNPSELIAVYHNQLLVSIYGQHPTKLEFFKPIKVLRNN